MDLKDIAIAAALAAAVVTYPPIRSRVVDEVNRMQENCVRYQLCVDLRAVGEKMPGTNCEPTPPDNSIYSSPY